MQEQQAPTEEQVAAVANELAIDATTGPNKLSPELLEQLTKNPAFLQQWLGNMGRRKSKHSKARELKTKARIAKRKSIRKQSR